MSALVVTVIVLMGLTLLLPMKKSHPHRRASRSNPFEGRFPSGFGQDKADNHSTNKATMIRCHNCAAYFPATQIVVDVVQGHVLEFCSPNCRLNFSRPN